MKKNFVFCLRFLTPELTGYFNTISSRYLFDLLEQNLGKKAK